MSAFVLFHTDVLTLATTRRVISADSAGVLKSMTEQAQTLSDRLAREHESLDQAQAEAQERGYEKGFESGRQAGLLSAQADIRSRESALLEQESRIQQEATTMAVGILRRLAEELDPVELISALAKTAIRHSPPDEKVVLRVHEQHEAAIAERIKQAPAEISSRVRQVIGEADVHELTCLVESPSARTLADIHTRIDLLEANLVDV